jgi:hypothetical protein
MPTISAAIFIVFMSTSSRYKIGIVCPKLGKAMNVTYVKTDSYTEGGRE